MRHSLSSSARSRDSGALVLEDGEVELSAVESAAPRASGPAKLESDPVPRPRSSGSLSGTCLKFIVFLIHPVVIVP